MEKQIDFYFRLLYFQVILRALSVPNEQTRPSTIQHFSLAFDPDEDKK